MYRILLLLICIHCIFGNALSQDKPPQKEELVVSVDNFTAKIVASPDKDLEVQGTLTFTVKTVDGFESIEGAITYLFSKDERQKISKFLNLDLSKVPALIEEKSALILLGEETKCSDFQMRLRPFEVRIEQYKIQFGRSKINLRFEKNSEKFGMLFCGWVRSHTNRGKGGYRIAQQINAMLEGKKID